jgi:putative oxidoreductase
MELPSAMGWISYVLAPSPASAIVDAANVVFRVSLGVLIFFVHGLHKLRGAIAKLRRGQPWPLEKEVAEIHAPFPFASAFAATIVQFVGGLLLILGLATRPVALVLVGTLGVAIYQNIFTRRDPQLAALYVLGVATLALWGGGCHSLDALLWLPAGGAVR